ncbi:hypothetical protein DER44DRAFT_861522 [Fusarium oxysporum]|nr:hypothetical protein DER44DRAFT_861522 [Fusarium oxysporum]
MDEEPDRWSTSAAGKRLAQTLKRARSPTDSTNKLNNTDLAIVSAYPAYEPTSTEAYKIDKARERLDRGSQDPEVREDSFFSVTTALTTMAEDAKSYAEDIQVLEHLDEDDKVTVLSATMPLALLSGETDATGHGTRAPVPSTGLSENLTSQTASDGDNEGTVLKTLKSRKATSAWVQPNQTVIAAYHHEDMLDSNDEPHQVPVHGTYCDNVWTPGNSGSVNGDKWGHEDCPKVYRLPVEIPGPESATPAVYVGISRVTIQHVFMRNKAKVNKVSFTDNTESFDLRAEPSNVVAGINTIFHEGCTVPGNISRLNRFVKDKTTVFEEQPAPMERLVRQNNRVLQYLPVEPVQNRKASDDAGHQPSYRILNRRELETILIGFILPRTWDV